MIGRAAENGGVQQLIFAGCCLVTMHIAKRHAALQLLKWFSQLFLGDQ